jgi:DNA-binding MarR family transcriptional regulator
MEKTKTKRSFDSIEQEAYLSLWRTYDRLRLLEDGVFTTWDITAQQYNVLRLLRAESEPVPTLVIANRLVSRAPDITRMLDRLEERRWIARTRSSTDRRAVLVSISSGGLQLLKEIAKPLKACHEQQLGHMSARELQSLCQLLQKVRAPHEPEDSPWNE